MVPAPEASAQLSCTAALDVDVHYCLDDADIGFPGMSCDPITMEDGDTVTLPVEATNDSPHNAGPPPADPPAGQLQVGQTLNVYYACNASTCNVGERLPGWLSFVATDYAEPGLSFSDDGNGYSGTLTVTAPVVYAEGSSAPRKVLRIRAIAHMPPAIENSVVFARTDGSQAAFLVTDNHCLAGLTGTGQGSTAGKFGSVPPPPCGNNGRITLASLTGKPQGGVSVALRADDAGQMFDPPHEDVTLSVSNANGVCFSQIVPANSPGWNGSGAYRSPDPDVRQGRKPGIASITFRKRASHGGQIQIRAGAFGIAEACNVADMTTTITVGNDTFSHSGAWRVTPNGWRFP